MPDTNALLMNPRIDLWHLQEIDKFTLVLTSTVSAELDSLKINHRNTEVREKSEKIIRQIKEYRRRGNLTDGQILCQYRGETDPNRYFYIHNRLGPVLL